MKNPSITTEAIRFLNQLEKNNNREWFSEHKAEFKRHESEVKYFFETLMENMQSHDDIERLKMFRIYRDVRFSNDKTPYKSHFACSFTRAGARFRGGYYVRIKPKETFVATGFWGPNKEDLLRIRKEFEHDDSAIRSIMKEKSFKKTWGELQGDAVKTAPKGFDKNHKSIDLIKRKQFIFTKTFNDNEVLASDFMAKVDEAFKGIRPYFDFMSEVLTTNLNGESLVK
ncbi:MAG: DUF2461 domain-containing protein [Aurantibacter sp.]